MEPLCRTTQVTSPTSSGKLSVSGFLPVGRSAWPGRFQFAPSSMRSDTGGEVVAPGVFCRTIFPTGEPCTVIIASGRPTEPGAGSRRSSARFERMCPPTRWQTFLSSRKRLSFRRNSDISQTRENSRKKLVLPWSRVPSAQRRLPHRRYASESQRFAPIGRLKSSRKTARRSESARVSRCTGVFGSAAGRSCRHRLSFGLLYQ